MMNKGLIEEQSNNLGLLFNGMKEYNDNVISELHNLKKSTNVVLLRQKLSNVLKEFEPLYELAQEVEGGQMLINYEVLYNIARDSSPKRQKLLDIVYKNTGFDRELIDLAERKMLIDNIYFKVLDNEYHLYFASPGDKNKKKYTLRFYNWSNETNV